MARLTTARTFHRRPRNMPAITENVREIAPYLVKKHKVKMGTRDITIDGRMLYVRIAWIIRLTRVYSRVRWGQYKEQKIPVEVLVPVNAISEINWKPGRWWTKPKLTIHAPGHGDPWCLRGLYGSSRPWKFVVKPRLRDDLFWIVAGVLWLRPELQTRPWEGFYRPTHPPKQQVQRRGWWARTFGTTVRYMRADMHGAPRRRQPSGRFKIRPVPRPTGGHRTNHHTLKRSR